MIDRSGAAVVQCRSRLLQNRHRQGVNTTRHFKADDAFHSAHLWRTHSDAEGSLAGLDLRQNRSMIVDGRRLVGDIGQQRCFLTARALHALIFTLEE
ncbi:MAG: hypothetical protein JWO52_622 [Gammaproteobacteria bacterium]|nr:hypothetical protein [Gammaproteobacteria bacterium]